jgi:hypothetical protein
VVPDWGADPFKMMSAHCAGSFVNIGDQVDEHGACEYVNAAGDKLFGVYARKGDAAKAEGTWHVVHGTGKFAGMTMDGEVDVHRSFPAQRRTKHDGRLLSRLGNLQHQMNSVERCSAQGGHRAPAPALSMTP